MPDENKERTFVHVAARVDKKIKVQVGIYCAKNSMEVQDFVKAAILEKLEREGSLPKNFKSGSF